MKFTACEVRRKSGKVSLPSFTPCSKGQSSAVVAVTDNTAAGKGYLGSNGLAWPC